jgi:hypothetical protein
LLAILFLLSFLKQTEPIRSENFPELISVLVSFSRQFGSTFIGNNTAWERNPTLCDPDPDFLPRGTGQDCVCAFLFKERRMRAVNATQVPQEIRGSEAEGSAVRLHPKRRPYQ